MAAVMKLLRRRREAQEDRSGSGLSAFAAQCARVTTPQGRKAHYRHPVAGVLCGGWPGADREADPSLPACQMCADELARLTEGTVA